jgi:hypothetical protein
MATPAGENHTIIRFLTDVEMDARYVAPLDLAMRVFQVSRESLKCALAWRASGGIDLLITAHSDTAWEDAYVFAQ